MAMARLGPDAASPAHPASPEPFFRRDCRQAVVLLLPPITIPDSKVCPAYATVTGSRTLPSDDPDNRFHPGIRVVQTEERFMSALFREIRTGGGFPFTLAVTIGCLAAAAATPSAAHQYAYAEGGDISVLVDPVNGDHHSSAWEHGDFVWDGVEQTTDAVFPCVAGQCHFSCCHGQGGVCDGACRSVSCGSDNWVNAACQPRGLVQRLVDHHANSNSCWIGRVDALILWRNAPPDRPLIDNALVTGPLLNANGMDSTAAAGPRFSLFRVNNCTGHAIEATYLRAANFRSMRPLSAVSEPYVLAPPGIFGIESPPFETGNANLGSRLQSFEFNRHHCKGKYLRFLAGFRWIEWAEEFSLQGSTANGLTDAFQTGGYNSLYGGQIGVDANLLALPWLRFDGLVKAGAFYNNAVMATSYATQAGSGRFAVGESPASGAFAGELGFTGVMPLTNCIDFRFGYFGLWLSGIAQPTQQLSAQQLTPGGVAEGGINTSGSVVVQGVSLGLEGRW
jgi:hypothetical protein